MIKALASKLKYIMCLTHEGIQEEEEDGTILLLINKLKKIMSSAEEEIDVEQLLIEEIKKFLIKGGNLQEEESSYDMTYQLIHFLSARNLINSVKFILEKGCDINALDSMGCSPLIWMFDREIDDAVQSNKKITFLNSIELIKLGADVSISDIEGSSTESIAKNYGDEFFKLYKETINKITE